MKQANKFLAKGAPETTCPYVGNFNFDPKIGTFACSHPHSNTKYCELNNPAEWEKECPYLKEAQSAVREESSPKESLGSRAMKFIKENVSSSETEAPKQPPLQEDELPASSSGAAAGRVQSEDLSIQEVERSSPHFVSSKTPITLSQFMLDRVGMAVKGPYVQYYYFTVEDFNTILTSVQEAEKETGGTA